MLNAHMNAAARGGRSSIRLSLPRLDANENIYLSRELESVDPVNYLNLFAGLVGRRYIPLVENVDRLDETYTYKMFEIVGGRRKTKGPGANDHPIVGVRMVPKSSDIKQIPVAYEWTVREIQQAARKGVPLDQLTVQAALSHVAREQDNGLAFGFAGSTITGLLNNALVAANNMVTPSTKSGSGAGTAWIRTVPVDPNEILADIAKLVSTTRTRLKQASRVPGGDNTPAFDRFTILLDSADYSYIASTPRSANSDTTILQYALRNNPFIESIEEWWQCDLADDALDGPRAVCYPRDPMCLGGVIPDDFTSLPPQEDGDRIVVPAGGSCGGTVIRYPVAVSYMDITG